MRKVGTVALALLLGFFLFSSCAKKRDVSIELLDACAGSNPDAGFRAMAKYVQFAVFPNACPADDVLASGDTTGARFTETVAANKDLPSVGDLPKSRFGFAVILRDDNCSVIGYGCTAADLDTISGVRIAACDWADKSDPKEAKCTCQPLKGGSCPPPKQCVKGLCKNVTLDASGCSLVTEASGKLPDEAAGAQLTGPAIAATEDGFVYGYRVQTGGTLSAVINYVSDAGKAADGTTLDLSGCSTGQVSDGVGLAYDKGQGLFVTSLPDCGSGAGSVFAPVDSKGNVNNPSGPRNAVFTKLETAQGNCVAPATTAGEYEFIYRVTTSNNPPAIERVILQGTTFKGTTDHPFGADDLDFAMVATTPSIRALLAPDASAGNTQILIDAHSSDALPGGDAGTGNKFNLPAASWAALTAWSSRVAAAVPASSGMTLGVWELAGGAITSKGTGLVGSGTVQGAALANLGTHLFVAEGKSGDINVIRLEDATGALNITAPSGNIDLTGSVGAANLSSFDGVHLAIAAIRDHVAVIWLTKNKPAAGDPTGGWALLRCSQ